jgi:5,10-methylene-tetrahydrofolate dehydrogenase/methenyl tetrahydrofolate cyclohydrolase
MQLIDGKKISLQIQDEIGLEVKKMMTDGFKQPHLAAILVGNDGGSESYVAAKIKACERVGFGSTLLRFEESVSEQNLLAAVNNLNDNVIVDGFIVQLPLPKHINEQKIIEAINIIMNIIKDQTARRFFLKLLQRRLPNVDNLSTAGLKIYARVNHHICYISKQIKY